MKKILLVIFIALASVACKKEEKLRGTSGIVIYYDSNTKYPNLDIVSGDKTQFSTSNEAYVSAVYLYDNELEDPTVYEFQNGTAKCNFDIGEVKMLDKKHFELSINPAPDCQYDAIGIFMTDLQGRNYSNGAFLAFFER